MKPISTARLALLLLCVSTTQLVEGAESKLVKPMPDGRLVMLPWNEQGDRLPDFAFCGYRSGGVKLPDVLTLFFRVLVVLPSMPSPQRRQAPPTSASSTV